MNWSGLKKDLIRLAKDDPSLRKDLVPLLTNKLKDIPTQEENTQNNGLIPVEYEFENDPDLDAVWQEIWSGKNQ
jgi:hypothetical protein